MPKKSIKQGRRIIRKVAAKDRLKFVARQVKAAERRSLLGTGVTDRGRPMPQSKKSRIRRIVEEALDDARPAAIRKFRNAIGQGAFAAVMRLGEPVGEQKGPKSKKKSTKQHAKALKESLLVVRLARLFPVMLLLLDLRMRRGLDQVFERLEREYPDTPAGNRKLDRALASKFF